MNHQYNFIIRLVLFNYPPIIYFKYYSKHPTLVFNKFVKKFGLIPSK